MSHNSSGHHTHLASHALHAAQHSDGWEGAASGGTAAASTALVLATLVSAPISLPVLGLIAAGGAVAGALGWFKKGH